MAVTRVTFPSKLATHTGLEMALIRYNDNNTEYRLFLDISLITDTSEHPHNNPYMSNVTGTGTPLFVVSFSVVYLRLSPLS
jgi:hypothetical protein